ncbi:MAG: EI24 domain-containing protein [Pseudomonadota bacterium]
MGPVIASLAKAFAQLADPAVLRVLAKSLLVTLALFAALGGVLYILLDLLFAQAGLFAGFSGTLLATIVITVFAMWILFRIIALAVLQFFADEIVRAVEQRHYPQAASERRELPFREDLFNSLRGMGRALLMNALALPVALILSFTAIGPAIVFITVNAVLLGRELTDMAWLRHRDPTDTSSPVGALQRLALGGVIAGLMLIPFANLLAPILGAAAGTHLTHHALTNRAAANRTSEGLANNA